MWTGQKRVVLLKKWVCGWERGRIQSVQDDTISLFPLLAGGREFLTPNRNHSSPSDQHLWVATSPAWDSEQQKGWILSQFSIRHCCLLPVKGDVLPAGRWRCAHRSQQTVLYLTAAGGDKSPEPLSPRAGCGSMLESSSEGKDVPASATAQKQLCFSGPSSVQFGIQ